MTNEKKYEFPEAKYKFFAYCNNRTVCDGCPCCPSSIKEPIMFGYLGCICRWLQLEAEENDIIVGNSEMPNTIEKQFKYWKLI